MKLIPGQRYYAFDPKRKDLFYIQKILLGEPSPENGDGWYHVHEVSYFPKFKKLKEGLGSAMHRRILCDERKLIREMFT